MNIAYIHTHDSGKILSPYGYQVPTPNLESFAKKGTVFRHCYCAGPTCSPSRAALLTGTYPHQNGMLGLAQRGFEMDYEQHLVRFLNDNGYQTVLCGIQHEAGWYLDQGGAEQIGYQQEITTDKSSYRQEELVEWDYQNAKRTCQWLKDYQGKQPFFLSFGMYATHRDYPEQIAEGILPEYSLPPYPIPDSKETRVDFSRYMTSLKRADECMGMVLETLEQQGILEDTIILITTDHGLANPFCKCTLFDSGIGVGFIMRCPGADSNGKVIDGLVSHVDVFPTLCELLDLEAPGYLEGCSMVPMLHDSEAVIRDAVFAEVNFHTSYEPIRCVRTERYKYIRYYDTSYLKINQSNIDESMTKNYLMDQGLKEQMKYEEGLYDLIFDTGERNNVAQNPEYAKVRDRMRELLECHLADTNDFIKNGHISILPQWKVNRAECETASSKNPEDYISIGR